MKKRLVLICLFVCWLLADAAGQILRKPIPDKLVVLTFDDAAVSHATYVAPLLRKYGFGGTFFVCEFPPDFQDKTKYMSWEQIRQLHKMGFEIASHTKNHTPVNKVNRGQLKAELEYIEMKCAGLKIKRPVTFAYPGYSTHPGALETLREKGYLFARAGGSRPYDPQKDHPYLLPSYSTAGATEADRTRVLGAIREAKDGRIVILTVHGVPDKAHNRVTTPPALFEEYLQYLHNNNYRVIALRDLKKFVNTEKALTTLQPDYKNLVNKP
jgi:peptidoglycan-N-acetylglucosamine deacetylase